MKSVHMHGMVSSGLKEKVCIVGSGNWGSAISRIVGANVEHLDGFDKTVNMW